MLTAHENAPSRRATGHVVAEHSPIGRSAATILPSGQVTVAVNVCDFVVVPQWFALVSVTVTVIVAVPIAPG